MINSGRFREDLWFRLNVFPIMIPPLRQRKEDIPALVHHFIERKALELKLIGRPVLAPGALDKLMEYEWPGNVRELENFMERALIQNRGDLLSFGTIHAAPLVSGSLDSANERGRNTVSLSMDEMTVLHIARALEMARGRINGPGGAAQLLGLRPNTLRSRMKKLGIPYGRKYHM